MSILLEFAKAQIRLPAMKRPVALIILGFRPTISEILAHTGVTAVVESVYEDPIQAYSRAETESSLPIVGRAVAKIVVSKAHRKRVKQRDNTTRRR